MNFYILEDRRPIAVLDGTTWGLWFEQSSKERTVARSLITNECYVSTVFLGLNMGNDPKEPPLLFETAIFGGPHKGYRTRSSTWAQAEEQHRTAVEIAQKPSLLDTAPLDEDI